MKSVEQILVRPRITEKSTVARYQGSVYEFEVAVDANKFEIASAIEKAFGVNVVGVRVANYEGKLKRMRQSQGRRADWKKAIVRLQDGQTINAIEGV